MTSNLQNLSLSLGNNKYSSETGLIQFFHKKDAVFHHTIPILENLTYSLSLLRSKEMKNIERAFDIMDACCRFQVLDGGFPRYIHEYPNIYFYSVNIDILNVFYWIKKEFKKIISSEVKSRVDKVISLLISFLEEKQNYLQESTLFRFNILKSAITDTSFDIENDFKEKYLYSKDGLKDIFLSLQIYDLENKKKITKDIWKKGLNLYNRELYSYIGPLDNLFQERYISEVTLSDLFVISFYKNHALVDDDNPILLLSSLIKPILNIDDSISNIGKMVNSKRITLQ